MRRDHVVLHSWAVGDANLLAYGHYGRPMIWFPSDGGRAFDFENNGLLDSVRHLLDEGRIKIYAIDSFDGGSWRRNDLPMESRAREHQRFEDFLLNDVVPLIYSDCGGPVEIMLNGQSFGAFHAANFCLRRADLFPLALCMSGVYDLGRLGWGERGDAFYFNNPIDYVAQMGGGHLDWIRSRASLQLVCGQGAWEDDSASGALSSTLRFNDVLNSKGIRHELDLWGYDVAHDWPSWRAQLAYHLPRFC
jgi:esterase/lipase superfamily enzyme